MGWGSCWPLPVIHRWNILPVCHSKDRSAKVNQFHSTHPQASSFEMTVFSFLRHVLTLSVFFDSFAKFYRRIPRSVCHMPLTFSALELANKIQAETSFPQGLKQLKRCLTLGFWSFIFEREHVDIWRKTGCFLADLLLPCNIMKESVSSTTYLLRSPPSHLRAGNPTGCLCLPVTTPVSTRLREPRRCWSPWGPCWWTKRGLLVC